MADFFPDLPEWAKGLLSKGQEVGSTTKGVAVRNMKQVGPAMKEVFGERIYPKGLPAPEVAAKAVAKGSPIAGLLAAYEGGSELYNSSFNPAVQSKKIDELGASIFRYGDTALGNPDNRVETPEAVSAGLFGKGIADRAVGAAKDAYGKAPDQYDKGLAQGKYPVNLMDPNAKPQASPQVAQEVESKRQVAEAGAKKQLAQGQLSRPKAAAAIVQADAQRSGEQLTPEQTKAKIAEETAVMKTMNDDELSKYLSYALIAGGLLASHLDKSGNAGQAFAGGFNAQLDRGQKEKLFKYQQDQDAATAAAKAALKERELTNAEANTESMIQSRADRTNLSREELAAKRENWNRTAGLAEAKLAAYRDRTLASAEGKSGKTPTAPALSQKDNMELVDNYTAGKGLDLDKGVLEAAASRLPNIQKNYPDLSIQEQMDLVFSEFEATPGKVNTFFPNTDPGYKLK